MARLEYIITGNTAGLTKSVNEAINLLGKLQNAATKLNSTLSSIQPIPNPFVNATSGAANLTASINGINTALNGINFNGLNNGINSVNANLNSLNATITSINRNRITISGGNGLFGAYGNIAALFALVTAGKKVVDSNAEISDSLASVRRTAGLTADEADNLFKQLEKIDTRTSLKGLLDISVIGGQLDISKGQLTGFTKAVNSLSVSLKDELKGGPEEVAKGLGILNEVFKVSEKDGGDIERAYNKIGSVVLGLGQSGLATGDYLVKFGEKVGGVAAQAKISLPVLLSYGATLQEQGVSAEVAGTAFKKLIASLSSNREKFLAVAKIADSSLTLKEFTRIINTDVTKALSLFFDGLAKGGQNTTQFQDLLKAVGLDASRTGQAVSALALHQEELNRHIAESIPQYNEATLAAKQAAIAEDTLAGSLDRLSKKFIEITTGGAISNFFKIISDGLTRSLDGFGKFSTAIARLFTNSNNLGFAANLSLTGLGAKDLDNIDEMQSAFKESSKIRTDFLGSNPIFASIGAFPSTFGNQGKEAVKKQLEEIEYAYKRAYYAYSYYYDGIKSGLLKDSDEGIGRISDVKSNAQELERIFKKVKEVYDSIPEVAKTKGTDLPTKVGSPNNSFNDARSRLEDLQNKLSGRDNESGLTGFQLDTQKTIQFYKELNTQIEHFNTYVKEQQQLFTSSKGKRGLSDSQASDFLGLSSSINGRANDAFNKELGNNLIKESQRVSNEIQRINDEFGVRAETGRRKELAAIQARYDAEVVKAKGNKEILSAIDNGRLLAIQAINEKYTQLEADLWDKIGDIDEQAQSGIGDRTAVETARINREWDKRREAANKYYQELLKIDGSTPNNPNDVLPGLTNANNRINILRSQNQTGQNLTDANSQAVALAKGRDLLSSLQSASDGFISDFVNGLENANQEIGYNFSSVFAGIASSFQKTMSGIAIQGITKVFERQFEDKIKGLSDSFSKQLQGAIAGLAIAGSLISGVTSKTSIVGQGLGGALSGAASGALAGTAIAGPVGTIPGAIIGGAIGLLGGIFGASKAQKELQQQQLEQQKQQNDLLQKSLAYTSQIIGRMTNQGVITNVSVGAFGQLTAKVNGKDLQFVLDRYNNGR